MRSCHLKFFEGYMQLKNDILWYTKGTKENALGGMGIVMENLPLGIMPETVS